MKKDDKDQKPAEDPGEKVHQGQAELEDVDKSSGRRSSIDNDKQI